MTVVHYRADESVLWKVERSTLYTTCMEKYLKQIAAQQDVEYKDVKSFLSTWYSSLHLDQDFFILHFLGFFNSKNTKTLATTRKTNQHLQIL